MKAFHFIYVILLSVPLCAQNILTGSKGITRDNPFAANPSENEKTTYQNPIIPGFYSDPSICRVGEDYYLITSTFEYFPGVPVFHSKDLVNWEQIGHCLDRKEQIPHGINIFAATIRHHQGKFYMITTNVGSGNNFYVTATNPAGPWSNPIWIDVPGIDPDLFFDEDGKAYVISSPFILFEIDIETGKLLSEGRKIWNSTGGRYSEAPHIYKKDGFYYLMAAEGGTEEAHSETISRSHNIWGPYIDNPANPILTHANAAGMGKPIQGIGHADMIEAHDGSFWSVFHGYRSVTGIAHHTLGRETCLAPVSWPKNAWPVINGNGTVSVNMTNQTLPLQPFEQQSSKVNFDSEKLGLEWNYLHYPVYDNYSLNHKNGTLSLMGSELTIGEKGSPTFLGRRIQHLYFEAKTQINFDPKSENEEAGLTLLNNKTHFDIVINKNDDKRILVVKLQFGEIIYRSEEIELKPGPVNLMVKGEKSSFTFSYAQGNAKYTDIETVDARYLSSETVGWFTGVYVGLYATGNGTKSKTEAIYDWFEYNGE